MHRARPEWGVGSIKEAQRSVHEGVTCQRLVVRFENGGLKTVSTAFADLCRADQVSNDAGLRAHEGRAPERAGTGIDANQRALTPGQEPDDAAEVLERLSTLPDAATDPFRPLALRLRDTLELYRFTREGASLLAWASTLTGLGDPLSHVGRHQLEQAFERFEVLRDRHLSQLLHAASREGIDVEAMIRSLAPGAQRALQRVNRRR